jgi:hypothetical protein
MNVYTVTREFSAPQLGVQLDVGDTIGKVGSRLTVLIGAVEYPCQAFYDWVGTADSLNYMSFTGVLPDPVAPGGAGVKGGTVAITSGASVVNVVYAFGFIPSALVVTVWKPVGGSNLFPTVRAATVTAAGFTVDLQAPAPAAGYILSFAGVQ